MTILGKAADTRRPKLGFILEKKISVGGGFNQSVTATIQMLRLASDYYDIEVYTMIESSMPALTEHGLSVSHFPRPKRKLAAKIRHTFQSARRRREEVTEFEKEMKRRGVDLVYFTAPSQYALDLQTTPYIFTIWDLCHLEHPEFPEVTEKREFEKREELYTKAVLKAAVTLTDSDHTTRLATRRYGVEADRFIEMPFSPAPSLLKTAPAADELESLRTRHGIPDAYLFYPAQFWAHKNHIRILEACALLAKRSGAAPHVVFAGGDQGHGKVIKAQAEHLGVSQSTHFLGFVSNEELNLLYRGASALVMASYFGPSNLPPMEAWSLGKPVLYPNRFSDFAGDAALYFDPDDATSLAQCIETLAIHAAERDWHMLGNQRLEYFAGKRLQAEEKLRQVLFRLAARRTSLP